MLSLDFLRTRVFILWLPEIRICTGMMFFDFGNSHFIILDEYATNSWDAICLSFHLVKMTVFLDSRSNYESRWSSMIHFFPILKIMPPFVIIYFLI